jgi:hypothetical protein
VVRSPPIVPGIDRDVMEQGLVERETYEDGGFNASARDVFSRWPEPVQALLGSRAATILARAATCAALLLLFLWPAIYNGQPLFSPDTGAYVRGFDGGMVWLTGRTTAWTTWASELPSGRVAANDRTAEAMSFQSPGFIMAGRSVSYGGLLYLGELLGKLWASIAIQGAVALAALGLTLRHLGGFSWSKFVVTAVTLGLASSLPFFTSFLLPDIFAGLALLAAANLLALGHRLARWEQVFWFSISAAAVVFHPSHLAIVAVLLAAAIVGRFLNTKISRTGIVALAVAVGIGFASESVFELVVRKLLGAPVDRPPVVMARIVADGPGASYLHDKCPDAKLVACEFADRLLLNSDAFLWDTSPATGIYAPAPIEKRRKLGSEQFRFAAAVLAYDPVGQLTAWIKDGFQQLRMAGISEFALTSEQALPRLPRIYADRVRPSFWKTDFPIDLFSAITIFAAMLSLIFVWITLVGCWSVVSAEQKIFCFVILLGELSNAFICGALSGPHERYQGRLTWLILLVALLLVYERWIRSEGRGGLVVSGPLAPTELAPLSPATLEHTKSLLERRGR